MAKYRIVKREYPNGEVWFEVQKKLLGILWCRLGIFTYKNLEDAEMALRMDKEKPKETIINVE